MDWPETQTELVVIRFFLQPQILFSANLPDCVALPKDKQKSHILYFFNKLEGGCSISLMFYYKIICSC